MAIIELDDPTHLEKVEEDRIRDQMLTEAGYLVKRYTNIPTVRQLQRIFINKLFRFRICSFFSQLFFLPSLNAVVHIVFILSIAFAAKKSIPIIRKE